MKYWKITNENEIHNEIQYKTGLNVDILPFNSTCACESGGIYFSSKDIFAFCDYGRWIREVTLPEGENVYENPENPKEYKAHRIILGERMPLWDINTFEYLVENGVDINACDNYALRWASEKGHLEIVKFLIENGADIHAYNDYAIRYASENGHLEVVKFLVENGADINSDGGCALLWASYNGHLEVVKFLIENGADVHAGNDCAICFASENGHFEIVKCLVENGANIRAQNGWVLRWAYFGNHTEIVKYLKSIIDGEEND